ncbi:beta-lactamase family protein [Nocardioidaceae bacterium SCSIO 66511]|nr:beta-lactamase family protein [Nocardioidaceae bacterium SCSIO 66511]
MIRPLLAVAMTATLTVVGPGVYAGPPHDAPSTATRELRAAMAALVDQPNGPPGVIVVVQKGHQRRTYSTGVADLESSAPMRPNLHMRVASTAKAYSGAVVLSLAERGRVRLNDTVGDRLPWTPRSWHRITLGQLLHHTSGLPDYSGDEGFRTYLSNHLRRAPSPRRLLRFVADERPEFRPGTRYQYSNSDNIAAALMVEDATGRSYERMLARQVLRPLGLRGTSLPRGVRMPSPSIRGYQRADDGTPEDVTNAFAAGYAWASGGIVSTPADQNRFIRAYVGRKLFGRAMQHRQFAFRTGGSEPPGPGRNSAGLAVFRYRTRCGTVYGHTGNTAGYTQFMAATKDGRRSVVVSTNQQVAPRVVPPKQFARLRTVFEAAVCTALKRTHGSQ